MLTRYKIKRNIQQQYNIAIDELVIENDIAVTPPDLYGHFESNLNQLFDVVHPNGAGYQSIANLWKNALAP